MADRPKNAQKSFTRSRPNGKPKKSPRATRQKSLESAPRPFLCGAMIHLRHRHRKCQLTRLWKSCVILKHLYIIAQKCKRMSSPRHGISRRSTRSSGMSQTKSGHLQKAKSLYHRKSSQRWPRIKARPIIDLSLSASGAQENGRLFSTLRV